MRFRNGQSLFPQTVQMKSDCVLHLSLNFALRSSRRDASGKVGRVRRVTSLSSARGVLRLCVTEKPKPSPRVLFVDDDSATRKGFTSYLASSGYDVRSAATGQQALALASTWAPDVIVLDLGLPDIDGWEVARQLKTAPRTTTIPIIALTGSGLPHERASAMRAGCDRHLGKPCTPADLVDAIQRCIDQVT